MNSDETSIRAANGAATPPGPGPAAAPEGAITSPENLPAKVPTAALANPAFLPRLKYLLDFHNDLTAKMRTPPMWGFVQAGAFAMATVMAFAVYHAMPEDDDWGGVIFILTFVGVLFAPDALMYLSRRTRKTIIRQNLEDALRMTLRNFPDEVEACGGLPVLVDRVELAALIEVLQGDAKAALKDNPDAKKS